MEVKKCKKCEKLLPLESFSIQHFNSKANFSTYGRKPKYQATCKECCAIWQRAYRAKRLIENPNFYKDQKIKVKLTQEERRLNSFISQRFEDAKSRSIKYGKELNITKEYLKEIWTGYCSITNFKLNFEKGNYDIGSLDCIIPAKGYTLGNVQWLSWRVNRAKGDLTNNEFKDMCRAVIERAETIETT